MNYENTTTAELRVTRVEAIDQASFTDPTKVRVTAKHFTGLEVKWDVKTEDAPAVGGSVDLRLRYNVTPEAFITLSPTVQPKFKVGDEVMMITSDLYNEKLGTITREADEVGKYLLTTEDDETVVAQESELRLYVGGEDASPTVGSPRRSIGDRVVVVTEEGVQEYGGQAPPRKNRWEGEITEISNAHGLAYCVRFSDRSESWYQPSELVDP